MLKKPKGSPFLHLQHCEILLKIIIFVLKLGFLSGPALYVEAIDALFEVSCVRIFNEVVGARFENIALYLKFRRYIRSILRFIKEEAEVRIYPAFFRYYAAFSNLVSSNSFSMFTRNKTFCEHGGRLRVFGTMRLTGDIF